MTTIELRKRNNFRGGRVVGNRFCHIILAVLFSYLCIILVNLCMCGACALLYNMCVRPATDRDARAHSPFFSRFCFIRTRPPLINIIVLFINANERPPALEMRRLRSAETAEKRLRACASAPIAVS